MPFLIIFVLLPIIEIAVFMAVGEEIGLVLTLLSALGTAILGGAIIRYQGLQVLGTAQGSLGRGIIPGQEIFDGFCLVAAGATLITPGFVTDTIGFLLLIPAFRVFLKSVLSKHFKFDAKGYGHGAGQQGAQSYRAPHDPDVIEADYETLDKD